MSSHPSFAFPRLADHFAVVGSAGPPALLNTTSSSPNALQTQWRNAIVDVAVVREEQGESAPDDYTRAGECDKAHKRTQAHTSAHKQWLER